MSASILAANRRHALQILLWQALAAAGLTILSALLWGRQAGWSTLVGGAIGIVSTAFMAFALLRLGPEANANRIVISFFLGWVIKALLTIGLLWIAFRSKAFVPLLLVAGFVLTFVAFWFAATRRRN